MADTSIEQGLTFDDVLLVPGYSKLLPKEADLKTQLTRDITMNIPLMSAAMDTVTEARLAIAMAEQGGIGVLHKSMSIEAQAAEVRKVKRFESGMVIDPMTVTPDTQIGELIALKAQYHFSGMPVVEGDQVVGIITNRDIRFETDMSQKVANLMTKKDQLITVLEGASREAIIDLFKTHRIEKVLVVNEAFQLRGMVTVTDIMRSELNPMACKDAHGQLRVAAAVSTGSDSRDRALALMEAGVDVLVVDTSHGHSEHVLEQVRWIKQQSSDIQIIGGNIATALAAEDLVKAGADAVKVGIGPGSICITRVVAGVGVPQITAIQKVYAAMKKMRIPVIADGGIRYSGDISKAIAAGADSVMIGGLFAGTEEAPGEVVLYQGRTYKQYRGMGSVGAMSQGSGDRYHQEDDSQGNYIPQGIEGRVPCKGALKQVVYQLVGGVQSTMGYTGCPTIESLKNDASFIRVTNAGVREGHAHSVKITKEAPNYSVDDH